MKSERRCGSSPVPPVHPPARHLTLPLRQWRYAVPRLEEDRQPRDAERRHEHHRLDATADHMCQDAERGDHGPRERTSPDREQDINAHRGEWRPVTAGSGAN
jgi:hypothetical protein